MRVGRVLEYIVDLYFMNRRIKDTKISMLLLGAPGIGKSTVVRDAAKAIAERLNKEYVEINNGNFEDVLSNPERYFFLLDVRLYVHEAPELSGLPVPDINKKIVYYLPPEWAQVLSVGSGILFLDEMTVIRDNMLRAALFQIALDRKIGYLKINDDVLIVAAGNRDEHNALAVPPPAPLVNRFFVIDVDPPTLDEWAVFMNERYGNNWNTAVYGYLKLFKEDFLSLPPDPETFENFPTPRSWTYTAIATEPFMGNPVANKDVIRDIATGYLGAAVGEKFTAFATKNLDVERIMSEPKSFFSLDLEDKYFVVSIGPRKVGLERTIKFVNAIGNKEPEFGLIAILALPEWKKQFLNIISMLKVNKIKTSLNKVLPMKL